jgi:hypothetical protein
LKYLVEEHLIDKLIIYMVKKMIFKRVSNLDENVESRDKNKDVHDSKIIYIYIIK